MVFFFLNSHLTEDSGVRPRKGLLLSYFLLAFPAVLSVLFFTCLCLNCTAAYGGETGFSGKQDIRGSMIQASGAGCVQSALRVNPSLLAQIAARAAKPSHQSCCAAYLPAPGSGVPGGLKRSSFTLCPSLNDPFKICLRSSIPVRAGPPA